jgi:hypothetical protein
MRIFCAGRADDWRAWLARNWRSGKEAWLVIPHGRPG